MKKNWQKIWTAVGSVGFGLVLFSAVTPALAKDPDYPTRPINYYIGFAAGGAGDLGSRAFLEAASKPLGQPFVPINKPGAGASLAVMTVISAKPDGYTLGYTSASPLFIAPFSGVAPYKDLSGLEMIVNFAGSSFPLLVRNDAPFKNWKEFIEYARKNPKAVKIGIPGAKSVTVQGAVLWQLEKKEQVEFTFIPMKGNAEILPATLAGHVNVYGASTDSTVMEYIREGKLRILTYLSETKLADYAAIPSLKDMYGISFPEIAGVVGPKGLPDYVLRKLDQAFAQAVKEPEFIKVAKRLNISINYMDRARMKSYVEEIQPKFIAIMKAMKAEEEAKK